MKVLEINNGLNPPVAPHQFPGAEVKAVAVLDWKPDGERYDIVFCPQALQLVEAERVPEVLRNMAQALVDGGELWLFTPSLEWAAQQAQAREPHPLLNLYLFGGKVHHRCTFTLMWLRILVEQSGLITRKAFQGPYTVKVGDRNLEMLQNCVIAMRYDAALDASKALE